MFVQSVDLAARFSAVLLREVGSGQVLGQFDSRDASHFGFAAKLGRIARDPECVLTIIEDVPYNPNYTQAMVKPVLKFQGVIMLACHKDLERVRFLDPSTWMKDYPGVQRAPKGLTKTQADKARIEAAAEHARLLGYEAPDLVGDYIASLPEGAKVLKKHTGPLEKSRTDYVSAFLISQWTLNHFEELDTIQGVSPAII